LAVLVAVGAGVELRRFFDPSRGLPAAASWPHRPGVTAGTAAPSLVKIGARSWYAIVEYPPGAGYTVTMLRGIVIGAPPGLAAPPVIGGAMATPVVCPAAFVVGVTCRCP
jgi:hypothetical protein